MSQIDEVCVKEPQCCEIFDRFCFGCREIKNLKAHQAYRERLRRLMVVPTPGGDPGEQNHEFADLVPRNKTGMLPPDEVVDAEDDDDIQFWVPMWERGEHTCGMFGPPPCAVCLKEGVHNYTPAFLGALVDLWDLFRKGGVGRKAAFLSGHENAIPFDDRLIGLVITGVEDLHKAELKGVNKLTCVRFKEFIETGSFKRLEEMRGSPTATIAHNYTPDFLEAMEELSKLYQAWYYKRKGLGYFASWIWRREMEHLKSQVITRVEDIDSERKCDVGFGLMFKEFIETGKINDLEEMRLKLSHNYTPDFLEALEELIELYQARALKSKKAAFRSSVWREEMRTLEWKVITRVEDIDSDTWESDLGLGQKFKEFIETGSFKRLEEMRGVISQPAGTTHYSIAYDPSIAGVITPTWQVWDAVTGIRQSDQLTMQTNTGVRAPSFPEAIKTVSYSGWYSESGGIYTDLGRKS